MTKNSRQKLEYLENGRSFYDETKGIFHHFKELSVKQRKQFFFGRRESDLMENFVFRAVLTFFFPMFPFDPLKTKEDPGGSKGKISNTCIKQCA